MVRKDIEAGAVIFAECAPADFVVYIIEDEAGPLKTQGGKLAGIPPSSVAHFACRDG
jgi:hypothetical protein